MDGLPKDDLKWFGEGFDGFPKRLPEDCVEYCLFIIDKKLSQREILSRFTAVQKEASRLINTLLKGYIWQRDEFALKLELGGADGLKYLHGLTNYGDSVEDEWLIVYLLKELSGKFPDLWIKVVDTDGEFLLIEAANALPRWLNPEVAENRVWINHNKLRIIPLSPVASTSSNTPHIPAARSLSLAEAHQSITTAAETLLHSSEVEKEAFYRLRNYPAQIKDSMHHARATVPRKLAYLIHNCPASIAPAVESFYLRDPIALKPLLSGTDKLLLPPEDLVTMSIRFTRVLYAQLKSQQFEPPPTWKPIIANAAKDPEKQADLARIELGLKVTSGYEMLLTDTKNESNRRVREMRILLEDLQEDEVLPNDAEIARWEDISREDGESWLDINFEDFERELDGSKGKTREAASEPTQPGVFGPQAASGFGDAKTETDLKKMVQRFEAFLGDEDAGVDGAEMDDMDIDDDDDDEEHTDDEDIDSEDENEEINFDSQAYAKILGDLLGLKVDAPDQSVKSAAGKGQRVVDLERSEDEDDSLNEGEKLRKVMDQIGAELHEAGALDFDPKESKSTKKTVKGTTANPVGTEERDQTVIAEESDSDEDLNIDFNLAKNLLESFKSQAGMAGPGGNLLGMMGMQLPRDEGDEDERILSGQKGKRIQ